MNYETTFPTTSRNNIGVSLHFCKTFYWGFMIFGEFLHNSLFFYIKYHSCLVSGSTYNMSFISCPNQIKNWVLMHLRICLRPNQIRIHFFYVVLREIHEVSLSYIFNIRCNLWVVSFNCGIVCNKNAALLCATSKDLCKRILFNPSFHTKTRTTCD